MNKSDETGYTGLREGGDLSYCKSHFVRRPLLVGVLTRYLVTLYAVEMYDSSNLLIPDKRSVPLREEFLTPSKQQLTQTGEGGTDDCVAGGE